MTTCTLSNVAFTTLVAGFGADSYRLGLEGLVAYLASRRGR